MKRVLISAVLSLSCLAASGAGIYQLTLDQSIEVAKERSYTMQTLENTYKIAKDSYKVSVSNMRTSVTSNLTLPRYNYGIREYGDNPGHYYSIKTLNLGGNLRIDQPLPTNGNIYLLTEYNTQNFYRTPTADPYRSGSVSMGIGLTQPLDALYGFNNTRADMKRAKLTMEKSDKEYKRAELDLIYSVSSSYYRLLLLQKRMDISKLDFERQSEAAEIAANKYEAGLIREVDALQMEVDLADAESGYDQAIYNVFQQTNSFKDLLGLDQQDSVKLISDLSYEAINIDPDLAVRLALENRLEMREQEINVEERRLNLKQQKAAGLPTASLTAYYGKQGINSQHLDLSYSDALSGVFDDFGTRPATYNIGLTVRIPIIDWGRNRARVRINQTQLEQAIIRQDQTEREIESQVRNLISSINSNYRRLQILEKSVVIAEKSFEITLKRYADGDIDSQAMASERTRLNNAYTTHLNAFIDYQLYITDLTRQTFYDFKQNRPIE